MKKQTKKFIEFYKLKPRKSITETAKEFCELNNIKYDDNKRRAYARALQKLKITDNKGIEKSEVFKKAQKKEISKNKIYFITAAQNATPIHKKFFKNILAYKDKLKAELVVIATRYHNPTSIFTDKDKDWWSKDVLPYLSANRHNIHKNLQILADIKISPTASNPLSGLNGISGIESCIVGHPRTHLKSLPVLEGYPHKLLMSTGMCTVANYTDSKAGKKGEFHHNLGFIIIEIKDDDTFFPRHIVANKNGDFYDLDTKVINGNVTEDKSQKDVIAFGDVHLGNHDETALNTSLEMSKRFRPKYTILNDTSDGYSVNPHDKLQPFELLEKENAGRLDLQKELNDIYYFLNKHKKYNNFVLTRSNHDDFLDRFLEQNDWRKSPNKSTYLQLAFIKSTGVAKKGLFPYLIEKNVEGVVALGINDSFLVNGREYGMHGHLGANGSRGSATQFKNLNVKTVTGHTHSPIRIDGHSSVGTNSILRQSYVKGISSQMHCNIIQHEDGNIQHLFIFNGEYTTLNLWNR